MSGFVISVKAAAEYIKSRSEQDEFIASVWIEGEVTPPSVRKNTCYFALKEQGASLDCMVFGFPSSGLRQIIVGGAKVRVRGRLNFYPPYGRLRLQVLEAAVTGEGELQRQLAELKKKLEQQGYFAAGRKRRLPRFPRTVAVVTSAEGAARHDFNKIALERNPSIRRLLYPTLVQGKNAPASVAAAIDRASRNPEVDVIVVTRGGGDARDLEAFNSELVVQAVTRARVPVVSAVGHESDESFCDLAADVRASTPSNAAELVIPEKAVLDNEIGQLRIRLHDRMHQIIAERRSQIDADRRALSSQGIFWRLNAARRNVDMFRQQSQVLLGRVDAARRDIGMFRQRAKSAVDSLIAQKRSDLNRCEALIRANDPAKLVARGYAIVLKDGQRISRAADLHPGDRVQLMFADGTLGATIDVAGEE